MVWVSNQSSGTTLVSITNNTGGNKNEFPISSRGLEDWETNHWFRTGNETFKLQLSNEKTKSFIVAKDNHVMVQEDAVLLLNYSEIKM